MTAPHPLEFRQRLPTAPVLTALLVTADRADLVAISDWAWGRKMRRQP